MSGGLHLKSLQAQQSQLSSPPLEGRLHESVINALLTNRSQPQTGELLPLLMLRYTKS